MGTRWVMRGHHVGRLLAATLGAGATALGAASAEAQVAASPQTLQKPGINVAERTPSPVPPAPEATMRAFQAVAAWVKEWKAGVPENLPVAAGAYVTLRLDGQIVGRGMELSADASGDAACIARAAAQAIEEARRRVPIEHDALFEENLRAIGPRIAVTLELAGALVPFAPKEYADAAADVAPGIEGVAVRAGERTAAMFPEQMLATGTDAGAGLSALVAKLTDDPGLGLKKPAELAAERGMVFYRFRTSTIGQAKAGSGAEFYQRGGKLVRPSEMTEAGLREWAGSLANALIRPRFNVAAPDSVTSHSSYDPIRGGFVEPEPQFVSQELLVAIALSRFRGSPGAQINPREQARLVALGEMRSAVLALAISRRGGHPDLAASALAVLASGEGVRAGGDPMDLNDLWQDLDRAVDDTGALASGVSREAAGPIALVLAQRGSDETRAGRMITSTLREAGASGMPSHMPWLGWADLTLHSTGDVLSAVALREMRSLVWQHQLKSEDLPLDQQDLAGGIVFTASKRGQALPIWQAARPLAFIATMLGDERLTSDAEVPAELSRLLASLRFLRQLTADEAAGHLYANPALALGGVRASPFDQRMPPEATALTLMTVCETLQSLEKIRKRREGAGAEPGAAPAAK